MQEHKDALVKIWQEEGVDGIEAYITKQELGERVKLDQGAWQLLSNEAEISLDELAYLGQMGIADLATLREEYQNERAEKLLEMINVCSFNLGAEMADCWPGDTRERDEEHFSLGLGLALDCLRMRVSLNKGAEPFALAWWLRGYFEARLGMMDMAGVSLEQAFLAALTMDGGERKLRALREDDSFMVLINAGYLGLVDRLMGAPRGEALYEDVIRIFRAQVAAGGETAQDAEFGIQQLEIAAERFAEEWEEFDDEEE